MTKIKVYLLNKNIVEVIRRNNLFYSEKDLFLFFQNLELLDNEEIYIAIERNKRLLGTVKICHNPQKFSEIEISNLSIGKDKKETILKKLFKKLYLRALKTNVSKINFEKVWRTDNFISEQFEKIFIKQRYCNREPENNFVAVLEDKYLILDRIDYTPSFTRIFSDALFENRLMISPYNGFYKIYTNHLESYFKTKYPKMVKRDWENISKEFEDLSKFFKWIFLTFFVSYFVILAQKYPLIVFIGFLPILLFILILSVGLGWLLRKKDSALRTLTVSLIIMSLLGIVILGFEYLYGKSFFPKGGIISFSASLIIMGILAQVRAYSLSFYYPLIEIIREKVKE